MALVADASDHHYSPARQERPSLSRSQRHSHHAALRSASNTPRESPRVALQVLATPDSTAATVAATPKIQAVTDAASQAGAQTWQQSDAAPPTPQATASLAVESTSTLTQPLLVRDLAHIPELMDAHNQSQSVDSLDTENSATNTTNAPVYDISCMPIDDIIEMVAGVLTKITTSNDLQHDHLHDRVTTSQSTTSTTQNTSVLAFHGKTVPSITILNYLNRIHKYCPTTYEVFVSLLIYFDRMSASVNSEPMRILHAARQRQHDASPPTQEVVMSNTIQQATPPSSLNSSFDTCPQADTELAQLFVVDSFNIHRLIISGVTCASKFFSDIFYTNSRYAKVGGLPVPELNHLELQFLLLNDFRLAASLDELAAYGSMLVEFYGREMHREPRAEEPAESAGAGGQPTTKSIACRLGMYNRRLLIGLQNRGSEDYE